MIEKYPSWYEQTKAVSDILYFAKHILRIRNLYPKWQDILREFYALDSNGLPKYRELVACVGMGSGKTYAGAIIGCYEFYKLIHMPNPQKYWNLDPATPIYIVNCAKSEAQAMATVFAFVKGFMLDSPYFLHKIQTGEIIKRHNEFEFPEKKVFLRSEHSASGSLAGKTSKVVVLDELDKFGFTATGESSPEEVYSITTKAVGRFGDDGKIVSISSPISSDGLFWRLVEKGKKNLAVKTLVIQAPTWEIVDLNLKPDYAYDSPMMTAERNKDLDKFNRDYGAIPVGRLVPFFPDVVPIKICEKKVQNPVRWTREGPKLEEWFLPKGHIHVIAGDPALRRDAFGLAMGHMENNIIMLDFTVKVEKIPPQLEIDARQVRDFLISILDRGFIVKKFITDIRSYPELFQDLERRGVQIIQSFVKKETYDNLKEKINMHEIFWPENGELFDELRQLEIISQRKVDHPKGGSKDISDAVANVAFYVKDIEKQAPAWAFADKW